MEKAAQIITQASLQNNIINVTTCAEGMDRTGTALEIATENWIFLMYEKFRLKVTRQSIEKVRALGCHNAYLASFATPGSTGMKLASKPGDLFLPKTAEYFYRRTGDTTRSAPIDEKHLAEIFNESPLDSEQINNEGELFFRPRS